MIQMNKLNNLPTEDLEARYPQLAIMDDEDRDPDGQVIWAGETYYQVFYKYSPMGDGLCVASATWCKKNRVKMIDD